MAILLGLSKAVESRDPHSVGHASRVSELADAIAVRLGWDDARRSVLALGGALHDVGKLSVPEAVLRKPGPLTMEEREAIRRHPRVGALLVWRVASVRAAVPAVLFHHERWDGRGYPAGRAGTRIPAEARVLAVADAFDAMTSDRAYRVAVRVDDALEEIDRCAGSQFDPEVAAAFLEAWQTRGLPHAPLAAAS